MKKFLGILRQCPLFHGVEENEWDEILRCLDIKVQSFTKNQPVFLEGDPVKYMGIVLSGEVQIVKEDYMGNRGIVTWVEPSQLFGEVFACAGLQTLPVSAVATCESEVMFIDCGRLMAPWGKQCEFHNRLVHHLLYVMAANNLRLNRKIELISKRTSIFAVRGKKNGKKFVCHPV